MAFGRLLALIFLFVVPAAAQRLADLYGRVLDTSDGGVSDALVTVINLDTGFRRTTQSQMGGTYSVGSLQPGFYKITVRREGFLPAVRFGIKLSSQAASRADFVLSVGSLEESITVFDTATPIEREDASTGSRVDRDEIARLPLNGRGLLTLLEFAPGTNVTPATRGEAGQFSSTGQRPNTNYFTVDGLSANTGVTAGGLPAQSTGGALPALSAFGSLDALISVDAVNEFHVTTSTSAADLGRMPGASISLTSRSGTDEFHGSTLYRLRNELTSANDWFGNQAGYGPLPLRLQDLTQTFGGPVKHGRTFFFLSYEGMSLHQPYVWRQPVPSYTARQAAEEWAQPLLTLFPAPISLLPDSSVGEWVGRSVRPASLNVGGARIDHAVNSRISIFGRYNDAPSSNEFGTLSTNRLDLRSQSLSVGLNARPIASLILDTRVNESQSNAQSEWLQQNAGCTLQALTTVFDPVTFDTPAPCNYLVRVQIGGVGQLISGSEGERRQRQFQFLQTASWHHAAHTLGIGLDYRTILAIRRDPTGTLGVLADSVAQLADRRTLWSAFSTPQNASTDVKELSLWVRDTWQATSRLTVSAGLRWEYSPAPVVNVNFLNPATNTVSLQRRSLWPVSHRNFAPRLGIAYRLGSDGRTVVRAGGGIYYDSSLSIATDTLNGGPLNISSYKSASAGLYSTILTFGFMPRLRLPVVEQWNLSVERALTTRDGASLSYVGSVGHSLIRRDLGGQGTALYQLVALTTNYGSSNYHALQFQYRRKVARGLQALATYSWSHSIDNDSSDANLLWEAPGASDRGSSDFDVRHSLTGSVTYEFPRLQQGPRLSRFMGGWAADAVFHARSGFPISVLETEEYKGLNLVNAFRPNLVYGVPLWIDDPAAAGGRHLNPAAFQVVPYPTTGNPQQGTLGRNSVTGFGMSQVDLALRREFHLSDRRQLQFRVEAFNLLNHANFADPVKYLNSPVFGQSTSMLNLMLGTGSPGSGLAPILQTGGPRSLQLGLRFQF